jgi:hypothetical protein
MIRLGLSCEVHRLEEYVMELWKMCVHWNNLRILMQVYLS